MDVLPDRNIYHMVKDRSLYLITSRELPHNHGFTFTFLPSLIFARKPFFFGDSEGPDILEGIALVSGVSCEKMSAGSSAPGNMGGEAADGVGSGGRGYKAEGGEAVGIA
jgi:hypothetical protein